ncbi:hypothetical protein LUM37_10820 [Bacillus subtilis]|nr:hypothetical protein LUM37_10820 [Bacillus subtilis]
MAEIKVERDVVQEALYAIEGLMGSLGIDTSDDAYYEAVVNDLQGVLDSTKGDD